jgi:hypothetical protein
MARLFVALMYFVVLASSAVTAREHIKKVVQSFLRQPSHQTAIVGEHVTLACRVVNKHGVLQWTRDGFGLGSDRPLQGFRRYRMTGSDEEGTT